MHKKFKQLSMSCFFWTLLRVQLKPGSLICIISIWQPLVDTKISCAFYVKAFEFKTRMPERYHVDMATTGVYKRSAVPFLQGLLNFKTRLPEKYHVYMATTGIYKRSSVPLLQGLLNFKTRLPDKYHFDIATTGLYKRSSVPFL